MARSAWIATALVCVLAAGCSGGSSRDAAATSTDPPKVLYTATTSTVPPTAPPIPNDVERTALPAAADLAQVTRSGLPVGALDARWIVTSDAKVDVATEAAEPGCTDLGEVVEAYRREYNLAPTGTKGEAGSFGQVQMTVRQFPSEASAHAWIQQHTGKVYEDCIYRRDHGFALQDLPAEAEIIYDTESDSQPLGGGQMWSYELRFRTPDGQPCTRTTDTYFNRVGVYGLSATFSTCPGPFAGPPVRDVMMTAIQRLADMQSNATTD